MKRHFGIIQTLAAEQVANQASLEGSLTKPTDEIQKTTRQQVAYRAGLGLGSNNKGKIKHFDLDAFGQDGFGNRLRSSNEYIY